MSKLPELTAVFNTNRSPKRFILLPSEGSEQDAGRLSKANIRLRREFLNPASVKELLRVSIMPYLRC